MLWSVPKIWSGQTVYILGGGPSLLDNNLSLLYEKRCIGVNSSAFIGNWIEICWFGDSKWWSWNRERLKDYPNLIVTCNPKMRSWKRIRVLLRSKNVHGIETDPTLVSWNHNSGCSAINLAYHLGAKRIVLLGFDMRRINGEKNWHTEYKEKEKAHNPFARHMTGIAKIKSDADRLGVEIINATKDSAIKHFEYKKLEELV